MFRKPVLLVLTLCAFALAACSDGSHSIPGAVNRVTAAFGPPSYLTNEEAFGPAMKRTEITAYFSDKRLRDYARTDPFSYNGNKLATFVHFGSNGRYKSYSSLGANPT